MGSLRAVGNRGFVSDLRENKTSSNSEARCGRELLTTITRVKRIPLLVLFLVSAMEFTLERARIDLVLMTGALTILLWSWINRRFGHQG